MKSHRIKPLGFALALALSLGGASGCQTYFPETGQTLPSGRYLDHPPQFIPPTPPFPLPREQAGLEQAVNKAIQQQQR
jgi:hypothetical protein